MNLNRADAYALVCEYTQSDSLRKHMLSVEAAVARRAGDYLNLQMTKPCGQLDLKTFTHRPSFRGPRSGTRNPEHRR